VWDAGRKTKQEQGKGCSAVRASLWVRTAIARTCADVRGQSPSRRALVQPTEEMGQVLQKVDEKRGLLLQNLLWLRRLLEKKQCIAFVSR
jgi:rhamnogalacturonyl hydrolase YesR